MHLHVNSDVFRLVSPLLRSGCLSLRNEGPVLRTIGAISVTQSLYELTARLSQAAAVHEVARVSVEAGKTVVGANAGSMRLISDDGNGPDILYSDEPDETAAPGNASAVLATGDPVFESSSALLPLLADGSSLGVLSFHFATSVSFHADHRFLLTRVAQHCAHAVLRARLYEGEQRDRVNADVMSRSKDNLLLTVCHELRTPLNAILGWGAMLRSGMLNAERSQRAIDAIVQHAHRQARLVDGLLEVSRMADGAPVLDVRRIDLGEIVRVAIEDTLPIAVDNGIDVLLGVSPGVYVRGDARRLEQVFLNLFGNAVKFTPRGGRVRIDMTPSETVVHVRCTDTGQGIDPALLPHVFDRFRRADSRATERGGGLGLGLFIARQLVEAHGGSIRAESDGPGCGTAITVTLPIV